MFNLLSQLVKKKYAILNLWICIHKMKKEMKRVCLDKLE